MEPKSGAEEGSSKQLVPSHQAKLNIRGTEAMDYSADFLGPMLSYEIRISRCRERGRASCIFKRALRVVLIYPTDW